MQTAGQRTDGVQLFFDSAGRMGRGAFWAALGAVLGAFALYERLVLGWMHDLTGWLVHFILFAAGGTVLVKRLHDRGRSGWWSALILLAFIKVWPWPHGLADAGFLVILACAAIDLGLAPGQAGLNRFGPQPR